MPQVQKPLYLIHFWMIPFSPFPALGTHCISSLPHLTSVLRSRALPRPPAPSRALPRTPAPSRALQFHMTPAGEMGPFPALGPHCISSLPHLTSVLRSRTLPRPPAPSRGLPRPPAPLFQEERFDVTEPLCLDCFFLPIFRV